MSNDFDWNDVLKMPSTDDIVREIFKIGINKPDKFKRTLLHAVVQKYHELGDISAVVDACIEIYASENKGNVICWQGDDKNLYEAISALIKVGDNMRAPDIDGLTPLHYAAWYNNNHEIISALVNNSPFIEIDEQDNKGRTALHYAARYNTNNEITLALMKNETYNHLSANPDIRDNDRWTPLHHAACYSTNPQVIETLLEETNCPKAKNKDGETALDLFLKHNEKLKNDHKLLDKLKDMCSDD